MRIKRHSLVLVLAAALLSRCTSQDVQVEPKELNLVKETVTDKVEVAQETITEKTPVPEVEVDLKKDIPEEPRVDESKPGELFLAAGEGLKVVSLVLGNGVEKVDGKKTPLNPGTSFRSDDTEKVIAFITVENPESLETELAVSFLAPGGASERGKVSVSIPARPKWATRAFYKIRGPAGRWTVIVRHGEEVVARAPFEFTM